MTSEYLATIEYQLIFTSVCVSWSGVAMIHCLSNREVEIWGRLRVVDALRSHHNWKFQYVRRKLQCMCTFFTLKIFSYPRLI